MQPELYRKLAEREDSYWWYVARRRLALQLLRNYAGGPTGRVIDLGCGTGGNLALYEAFAPTLVVGVDLSPEALALARRKHPALCLARADLSDDLPFAPGSFDIATLFNVLYHEWVTDDLRVLDNVCRLLRPGGLLLVTEAAFGVLRRSLDRIDMGRRRYTASQLSESAARAGFEVLLISYMSSFAFPIAFAAAMLDRSRIFLGLRKWADFASLEFSPMAGWLNRTLLGCASGEARVIAAGWRLPLGVGLVAALRRRDDSA